MPIKVQVLIPPSGPYRFVPVRGGLYRRVEHEPAGGAYDSKDGLTSSPRYSAEQARRLLAFLSDKLNADDFAQCWKMIEPRIDWGDRSPPRRNGDAHAAYDAINGLERPTRFTPAAGLDEDEHEPLDDETIERILEKLDGKLSAASLDELRRLLHEPAGDDDPAPQRTIEGSLRQEGRDRARHGRDAESEELARYLRDKESNSASDVRDALEAMETMRQRGAVGDDPPPFVGRPSVGGGKVDENDRVVATTNPRLGERVSERRPIPEGNPRLGERAVPGFRERSLAERGTAGEREQRAFDAMFPDAARIKQAW